MNCRREMRTSGHLSVFQWSMVQCLAQTYHDVKQSEKANWFPKTATLPRQTQPFDLIRLTRLTLANSTQVALICLKKIYNIHMDFHISTHIHAHTLPHRCVGMYGHTEVCMHACMYIHMHHTQTQTHTYCSIGSAVTFPHM